MKDIEFSKITELSFQKCEALIPNSIDNWDTSKVIDMDNWTFGEEIERIKRRESK